MLKEEQAIGDYTTNCLGLVWVSSPEREIIVKMIEDIYVLNEYSRQETLYLAVSLFDRYLAHETINGFEKSCIIRVGATCILIAVKLE